jgi:hypothetical protein
MQGPVCHGASTTALLPIVTSISPTFARGVNGIKLPDQFASLPSPTTVRISATLDAAGRARFAEQRRARRSSGPRHRAPHIKTWQPVLINGVAMPLTSECRSCSRRRASLERMAPVMPPPGATGHAHHRHHREIARAAAGCANRRGAPAPPGFLDSQLAKDRDRRRGEGRAVPVPLDAAGPWCTAS